MKLALTILALSALLAGGCSTREISIPGTNLGYKSTRFGNKENIRRIEYRSIDGSVLIVEGFVSDQVEALGVVTEAAVKGAVAGAKGSP